MSAQIVVKAKIASVAMFLCRQRLARVVRLGRRAGIAARLINNLHLADDITGISSNKNNGNDADCGGIR